MDNLVIRPPTWEDAPALLAFYDAFQGDDARRFHPWDISARSISIHLTNAALGRAASKIAVAADGRIVGHAFVRYLWTVSGFRQRSVTPGIEPSNVQALPALWKRILLILAGKRFRPRLGVGLLPEARGQGIGRQLVQRVLKLARDAGASEVRLLVHKSNVAGIALYHRVGFTIIRTCGQQERGDSYEMIWRPDEAVVPRAASVRA